MSGKSQYTKPATRRIIENGFKEKLSDLNIYMGKTITIWAGNYAVITTRGKKPYSLTGEIYTSIIDFPVTLLFCKSHTRGAAMVDKGIFIEIFSVNIKLRR